MSESNGQDQIDRIVKQWRTELPALDPSPLGVVGRVIVLAQHLEKSVSRVLGDFNLSLGQFDILATLRRRGPNGGLSPSELLKNVALSSGGMTARLDKLEEAGFIVRKQDPNDRRMLVIDLTPRGRQLIEAAAEARFAEARESLPPFAPADQAARVQLLRRWLAAYTAPDEPR